MRIFHELCGTLRVSIIKRWCRKIHENGSILLSTPLSRARVSRASKVIQKVTSKLNQKKKVSVRSLPEIGGILKSSMHQMFKEDLKLRAYQKATEPKLTDEHNHKKKRFANWVNNNFRRQGTIRILFSDVKMFGIDGIENSQNDRIRAVESCRSEWDRIGLKRSWFGWVFASKEWHLS